MKWLRENKFLGAFLIAVAGATLVGVFVLAVAKSSFTDSTDEFNRTTAELTRLQRLHPFPNEPNLRLMKRQAADYGLSIAKLKEELKAHVVPVAPMKPNEFQARLRQTVITVTEKARTNRVKLPDKFLLGFEEFTSALPSDAVAPLLGQQLAQSELLIEIMIDARIDALTAFKRSPITEHRAMATARDRTGETASSAEDVVKRSVIQASFVSTPLAARRVLNQIANAHQQFFIIRTLHVVNEKDKGPVRAQTVNTERAGRIEAASAEALAKTKPAAAIHFIVGAEHLQTSADIELVRFTF